MQIRDILTSSAFSKKWTYSKAWLLLSRPSGAVASSCQAANLSESILKMETSFERSILSAFEHYLSFTFWNDL